MKTIGLIGGMSWESSIEYYRIINQVTKTKGGLHSARSVMYSVDFADATASRIQSVDIQKVGLLGTRFTMDR